MGQTTLLIRLFKNSLYGMVTGSLKVPLTMKNNPIPGAAKKLIEDNRYEFMPILGIGECTNRMSIQAKILIISRYEIRSLSIFN